MRRGNLHQFIQSIQRKPGIYLRNMNLAELSALIAGYEQGFCDASDEDVADIQKFNDWVRMKYGDTGWQDWYSLVRVNSINDENALKLFFELWEECHGANSDS